MIHPYFPLLLLLFTRTNEFILESCKRYFRVADRVAANSLRFTFIRPIVSADFPPLISYFQEIRDGIERERESICNLLSDQSEI